MQTNRPVRPAERSIDIRMRVLGRFGFLLLAALFFSIGVFYIGPRLKSAHEPPLHPQAGGRYVPSVPWQSEESEPKEQVPDIELEVTESGVGDDPAAGQPTESEPPDEVFDGKSLTITLDGKGKTRTDDEPAPSAAEKARTSTTSKPKTAGPEKSARPSSAQRKDAETSGRSSMEKPRAATEKRTTVYRVQAGSYADRSHADDLAAKLKREGYRRTTITEAQVKGRTLYRVQVAEYKTAMDAEELSRDLKATGYEPAIITGQ